MPALDLAAVLQGQGLDPAAVRANSPRLVAAADEAKTRAAELAEPRVALGRLDVRCLGAEGAVLEDGRRLSGPEIAGWLQGAEAIVAAVCTIGSRLERVAAALLEEHPVKGMALDGAGNAALLALSALVCEGIAEAASGRGWRSGTPHSPGVAGWPLERGQRQVFQLVDARAIGVELLESAQMTPVKSVTMIVGLGPGLVRLDDRCEICDLHGRCRHAAKASRRARCGSC